MKFSIMTLIAALIFTGCANSANTETQDTHKHEDGTEHGAHTETAVPPSKQEEFSVESDSTLTPSDSQDDHGHEHSEADAH